MKTKFPAEVKEVKAVLALKTSDEHWSKIMSSQCQRLVLDVYMSPTDFGQLLEQYEGTDFVIQISP